MPGSGEIISRRNDTPQIKLGIGMGGIRGLPELLQFMMDMFAETKAITEEYRDAQRETNRLLTELNERMEIAVKPFREEKTD